MHKIPWLPEELRASQEYFCSMELLSFQKFIKYFSVWKLEKKAGVAVSGTRPCVREYVYVKG
jgi:hypothetical protein